MKNNIETIINFIEEKIREQEKKLGKEAWRSILSLRQVLEQLKAFEAELREMREEDKQSAVLNQRKLYEEILEKPRK